MIRPSIMRIAGYSFFISILMLAASTVASVSDDPAPLCDRLHRFDISCRMFDERFGKKSCGVEHSRAFTELIGIEDKAATLAFVEDDQKKSKERLKELEAAAAAAPPADAEKAAGYEDLIAKADEGDIGAIEKLRAEGPAVIPAILRYRDGADALPSRGLQSLLAQIEAGAEAEIASGSPALDAEVVKAFVDREKKYGEMLKRAVIALEGARRAYPHWLPLVYAYGIGFIPFFVGIVASVIYYGGFRMRVFALIMFCYFFYVGLHGFFQLIAPWI